MNIRINDIVKSDVAFSSELGRLVRESYGINWQKELIVFDFEGMRNVSPSFLSQSLMPILESVPVEKLSEYVQFQHTPIGFDYAIENVKKAMMPKRPRNTN